MEDVLRMIKNCFFEIDEKIIKQTFALSVQSQVLIDTNLELEMNKTEFMVFLARLAHELFNLSTKFLSFIIFYEFFKYYLLCI